MADGTPHRHTGAYLALALILIILLSLLFSRCLANDPTLVVATSTSVASTTTTVAPTTTTAAPTTTTTKPRKRTTTTKDPGKEPFTG